MNIIYGIIEGLQNAVNNVLDNINWVANQIMGQFKNALGIHSPSRVFANFGEYMMLGLAGGIEDTLRPVSKAMDDVEGVASRQFESSIMLDAMESNINDLNSDKYQVNDQLQQPLLLQVEMNGRTYQAFVDDISEAQDKKVKFEEIY